MGHTDWTAMFTITFIIGFFCLITNASGLRVSQPPVLVANRHGKVTLVCDYRIHGKVYEMRFTLLKKTGNQIKETCAFSFSTNYEYTSVIGDTIHCEGEPSPSNVTLHISGMQVLDTGTYICRLDIMYPPPYRTTDGNGTLIYVSDLESECAQSSEPAETSLYQKLLTVLFPATSLYSVFITIALLCGKRRKKQNTGYYEKMLESDQENRYLPYYIHVNQTLDPLQQMP